MPVSPLPFGNSTAETFFDPDLASDQMAKIVPTMVLDSLSKGQAFRTRIAVGSVGWLRVLANSATPCRMEVEESRGWHLVLPYIGLAALRSEGREYQLQSGANSLLLPNMRRSTERTSSSVIIATIDAAKLTGTMAAMAGQPADRMSLCDHPIEFNIARVPGLFHSFTQICRLIEASSGSEGLARSLGAEDMIYRWIALALEHSGGDPMVTSRGRAGQAQIDLACDLMRNSAERAVTMTELELATGLSARAVQYAFRARFGISPMEWQRRERMLMAQVRLMQAEPSDTITAIAHSMGFSSSSAFATLYKQHFGEMPSQTLRRRRAR